MGDGSCHCYGYTFRLWVSARCGTGCAPEDWLRRRWIFDWWPIVLLLLLWQIGVSAAGYNSIVMVPPGAVVRDLAFSPGAYLAPTGRTLMFALGGLAIGMAAGLLLAIAAWFSEILAGITTPAVLLLSSTPVVCLIPIVARLFGYEGRTELIAVGGMTFFPSFVL